MPIFDFHCPHCEVTTEFLIRGDAAAACPRCGAADLEKQVSAPVAPGTSAGKVKAARAQARREGHFSNY